MLLKNINVLTIEEAETLAAQGIYFVVRDGKIKGLSNK